MKFSEKIKQRASDLKRDLFALMIAYKSPRTPWYAKAFTALVVAYAMSPIDLIPDFVPVLGYLDDLLLIPAGIALALKMIPPEVMQQARAEAAQQLAAQKPVNWWMGAAILLLWAAIVFLIARWILGMIPSASR